MFRLITIEREYGCGARRHRRPTGRPPGLEALGPPAHRRDRPPGQRRSIGGEALRRAHGQPSAPPREVLLARQLRAQFRGSGQPDVRHRPHDVDDAGDHEQNWPGRERGGGGPRRTVSAARASRRVSRFSVRSALRENPPRHGGRAQPRKKPWNWSIPSIASASPT